MLEPNRLPRSGTPLAERIEMIDALRGMALLGIVLMNIEWFSRPLSQVDDGPPPGLHGADAFAAWTIWILVQGKFWILFSLLFGIGFSLFAERASARLASPGAMLARRLSALLVIGVLHAILLWPGDILVSYALAGMLLLGLRGLPPKVLLGYGLLVCALALAIDAVPALTVWAGGSSVISRAEALTDWMEDASAAAIYAHGDWLAITVLRWREFARNLHMMPVLIFAPLGVFMLGSWLWRSGRLAAPEARARWFAHVAMVGGTAGALLTCAAVWVALTRHDDAAPYIATALLSTGALPLAAAYLAVFVLAWQRPAMRARLRALAPAGRMALSNYLLQSLVGSSLFFGYGLGLWGQVGRAGQTALALGLFAIQAWLSAWWLARFRQGPMEWVWRWVTYGQRPPLRNA